MVFGFSFYRFNFNISCFVLEHPQWQDKEI